MTIELVEPDKARRHYTGKQVFPIVAALMFALSAVLWWPVLQIGSKVDPRQLMLLLIGSAVLLAAFLAGELFPLQIEVRRETLLVSGSELPMVVGLLLLPAWSVGAHTHRGRRSGVPDPPGQLAQHRRQSVVHHGRNRYCGPRCVTLWSRSGQLDGMRYLAVAVGVLAGAMMSAVAVGLTYRLLGPAEPLRRVVGRSMLSAAAIVTFALVGYTVGIRPVGLGALLGPGRRAGRPVPHLFPVPPTARRPDPDVQLRPSGHQRRLALRRLARRSGTGPRPVERRSCGATA